MRVLLLGATGTIGLATARALITSGHDLVCFVRPRQGAKGGESEDRMTSDLKGSTIRYGELTDPVSIARDGFANESFDAVISCMASRTGSPRDAWRIDYQAHMDALEAAQAHGVKHFVLHRHFAFEVLVFVLYVLNYPSQLIQRRVLVSHHFSLFLQQLLAAHVFRVREVSVIIANWSRHRTVYLVFNV